MSNEQQNAYDKAFSPAAIIGQLVRFRVATARKRRDAHRLFDISPHAKHPMEAAPPTVDHLFPPRRQWSRPHKGKRRGATEENIRTQALTLQVLRHMQNHPQSDLPWRQALEAMIERVLSIASNPDYSFSPPHPFQIPKENGGWRKITVFKEPAERVVLALLNRYMTRSLDYALSSSVFAFRANKDFNRHTAIQAINAYRTEYGSKGLYVAECDIEDFFNHIPHAAARAALQLAEEKRIATGLPATDIRALHLANAYLKASAGVLSPEFPEAPQGLPQGGTLSTLFANLVLSQGDDAVKSVPAAPTVFYARFCDDIIIAHPDRDICRQAFHRYIDTIHQLGLATHPPQDITACNTDYYQTKSKNPFLWADPALSENAIDWIGFLGYQMRFDGTLRIRQSSLANQQEKQHKTVDDIMRIVKKTPPAQLRTAPGRILHNTIQRLIYMSVGNAHSRHSQIMQSGHCWADAFHLLDDNPHSRKQMRVLDKSREKQIHRMRYHFKKQGLIPNPLTEAEINELLSDPRLAAALEPKPSQKPAKPKQPKPYHGAPYSYYATITRATAPPHARNTYNA